MVSAGGGGGATGCCASCTGAGAGATVLGTIAFGPGLGRWSTVGRMLTASEITSATTPTTKIDVSALPTSRNGLRPSSAIGSISVCDRVIVDQRIGAADRRQLSFRAGEARVDGACGGAVGVLRVGQADGGRLEGRRIGRCQRRATGQREFRFVGRTDRQADEVLQV